MKRNILPIRIALILFTPIILVICFFMVIILAGKLTAEMWLGLWDGTYDTK